MVTFLFFFCFFVFVLFVAYNGKQPGDPNKGVEVLLDVIRGEGVAAGKAFPTALSLGSDCYSVVKAECEKTLERGRWSPRALILHRYFW